MNRYRLTKAGINVSEGLHRFGGNQEIYEKFLMKFPENESYKQMLDAIEKQDVEAAFQASHALKGVAGNLSLEKLYQAILPLVEEFRAGRMEQTGALLPPVKEAYETVMAVLTANG